MSDLGDLTARVLSAVVAERGGSPRPGQERMAAEVAAALEGGTNLVIQAGTGIGKSVGYLVPLMLRGALGGKVQLVSTASLALQRQILTLDGPLVQRAVKAETGREVSFNLLKGWSNYLCRYRMDGGLQAEDMLWADPESGKLGAAQVEALREWGEETDTGDRDDLEFAVGQAAWAQVSVSKRECLAKGCPFWDDCFPQQAKETAFDSDVVVTNHALLGVYANGRTEVLPEFESLVVDEAHDLAARIRTQGTEQLSAGIMGRVARTVRKCSGSAASDLEDARDRLVDEMDRLPEGLVDTRPDGLRQAMQALDQAIKDGRSELKPARGQSSASDTADLQLARAGLDGLDSVMDTWSVEPEQTITWVSETSQGYRFLNFAPLDVAGLMAQRLFADHPTILTSATLALGGKFDQVRVQTGIDRTVRRCDFLDVGTSFDPSRQGILYVARHMPLPGREGVAHEFYPEMADLVRAAGGGALGLFSSMQGTLRAAEYLRDNTDFTIFVQGEDNLPTLVQKFRDDPDSCLLGTLSLWQGVDVPGPSCRLVVIDRIPFPRPTDPIVEAQGRAATRARRSAFLETSLAPATLLMAQGTGRLLRSADDRGVVAILDSRMATKSYRGYIRSSLLPFWYTEDIAIVRSALARLRDTVNSDEEAAVGDNG